MKTSETNTIPDVQSSADTRRIAIDKVGIKSIRHPVRIQERAGSAQHTVAIFNMYVGLPQEFKGTHMSRFVQILNAHEREITVASFQAMLVEMVAKLEEGYDLVAGWRKHRRDKFVSRRLPSMIANRIISAATDVRLHDYGCTLKVMTGDVARGLRLYGEMHRFIPALANEMGARIVEVPVNHRERRFGKSKYGISRTIRVILDLITVKFLLGYSKRPIHLFGVVGAVSSILGTAILAMLTFQRL